MMLAERHRLRGTRLWKTAASRAARTLAYAMRRGALGGATVAS